VSTIYERLFILSFFYIYLIYIIFSWKLTLGQPAGFLRHLIVLTPLNAIIALLGMNALIDITKKDMLYKLIPQSIILIVLIYYFSSYKLMQFNSFIYTESTYDNLIIIVLWTLFFAVLYLVRYNLSSKVDINLMSTVPIIISIVTIVHTIYVNPPKAHNSNERELVAQIADWFIDNEIPYNNKILSNHPYFFWSGNFDRGSVDFMKVNLKNIKNAPIGSVILWDMHYCRKQYTKSIDLDGIKELIDSGYISINKGFSNFAFVLTKVRDIGL
tara:strand:- start:327 stop:1139 length:813 start_codon:yes stop_codon:yes gene_type:complete